MKDKFCVFIDYPYETCAVEAIRALNGYNLMGKSLIVKIKDDGNNKKKGGVVFKDDQPLPKSQKPIEDLPDEAISCHICRRYKFESQKDFLAHLRTEEHTMLSKLYNERNTVMARALRQNSKICAMREKMKLVEPKPGHTCDACFCEMPMIPEKSLRKSQVIHENILLEF